MKKLPTTHIASGVPICGLTGVNGAGKTLLASHMAIVEMARGRTVYSTVEVKSEHGETRPIESLLQLLFLRDATILLDEVAAIFPSSVTQLPAEVDVLLQSLRHKNLTLLWTAPTWMRAHKRLREMTQGLVNVTPLRATEIPVLGDFFRNDTNPWPAPGLVLAGLMDTSAGRVDEAPTKVLRRRVFAPKRLSSWGAYDTLADTPLLGGLDLGGICPGCYGSQQRPKHTKERHDALGLPWYDDASALARLGARSARDALAHTHDDPPTELLDGESVDLATGVVG